jgi:hypothetical protein
VTHGDARWFAFDSEVKLAAAAGGASGGHCLAPGCRYRRSVDWTSKRRTNHRRGAQWLPVDGEKVTFDPQRHFATANYRIAKRAFALLGRAVLLVVGAPTGIANWRVGGRSHHPRRGAAAKPPVL